MKTLFSIIILFLSVTEISYATEEASLKLYHEANMAYQKLDYTSSIDLYEKLVKENTVSAEIYYNLGNAYFKAGNFAKAILNYEKAKKITPDDEDIDFNLKMASLKVVDKIESVPEIFYKRWINSFSTSIPSNSWSIIFISLIWFLFGSASLYLMGKTVAIKKTAFIMLLAFLFLSGGTGIIAARSHNISHVEQHAIIMSSSVYIKSSPDEKGNDLFILHEGTKIEILDELNGWNKIRISNGGVGWIQTDEILVI